MASLSLHGVTRVSVSPLHMPVNWMPQHVEDAEHPRAGCPLGCEGGQSAAVVSSTPEMSVGFGPSKCSGVAAVDLAMVGTLA